ncbi:MAG: hypothetical protein FRX49_10760 [Trebouxia sp. A1-2]|nr:MAG: hypothetical protein FRX49_10760 [Trebouxia sp. A1-2]
MTHGTEHTKQSMGTTRRKMKTVACLHSGDTAISSYNMGAIATGLPVPALRLKRICAPSRLASNITFLPGLGEAGMGQLVKLATFIILVPPVRQQQQGHTCRATLHRLSCKSHAKTVSAPAVAAIIANRPEPVPRSTTFAWYLERKE